MRATVTVNTERFRCVPELDLPAIVAAIREAADRLERGETEGEVFLGDAGLYGYQRPIAAFGVTRPIGAFAVVGAPSGR